MNNACRKLEPNRISMDYGKVIGKDGPGFMVEIEGASCKASRAVNCLVEPEPGDLVLTSGDLFGRRYILSVLERRETESVSLSFEGDVELKVNKGRFSASARDGIDMVSAKEVCMASPELSITSVRANLLMKSLNFMGSAIQGRTGTIKLFARSCDSVFERVTQRAERSYRWVSGLEQLKAGRLSYQVQKLMSMRSKYASLFAKDNVKIDAKQVHLG